MINIRPTTHSSAMQASPNPNFREAKRIQQSFLANLEKRTLIWLAARTPAWINSDHLTLLGLLSMAGAGAAYWWSATNRLGLVLVVICLGLNWLGDSLDGTLARFRDHSRPRYGFYVDHVVDAFSAFFLLGGLALSGYMAPLVALGLLVAYLMLSVEVYLATYALGDFKISYYKMGPTELRILLSIGNLALLWKSTAHVLGRAHRLFDVAGTLGISGMLLIMVISAVRNTVRLYRQEPIPVGRPVPAQKQLPLGLEKSSPAADLESQRSIRFVFSTAPPATEREILHPNLNGRLMAQLVVTEKVDGTPVAWRCSACDQSFSAGCELSSQERIDKVTSEFKTHMEECHKGEKAKPMAFAAAVPLPKERY